MSKSATEPKSSVKVYFPFLPLCQSFTIADLIEFHTATSSGLSEHTSPSSVLSNAWPLPPNLVKPTLGILSMEQDPSGDICEDCVPTGQRRPVLAFDGCRIVSFVTLCGGYEQHHFPPRFNQFVYRETEQDGEAYSHSTSSAPKTLNLHCWSRLSRGSFLFFPP